MDIITSALSIMDKVEQHFSFKDSVFDSHQTIINHGTSSQIESANSS